MIVFNGHLHLNGSVSLDYLKQTAQRNKCVDYYEAFIKEKDIWVKFGLIHKIIQSTADIKAATIDVVKNSTAHFLEIRTTPKALNDESVDDYINAFVQGLKEATEQFEGKKARGLLSIDRSRHNLEDAKDIIDRALKLKQATGMIVGIDLSGNFKAKRKLTGQDLYEAMKYGLSKDIGLALHVGEDKTEIESSDFDVILKAISEYEGQIHGKVRLGHAIYRTQAQDKIIAKLQIPVEICPSCHDYMGWAQVDQPHPILTLYKNRRQVLAGTDDSVIFNCDDKKEQETLDSMLQVSQEYKQLKPDEQDKAIAEYRMRYMF